MSKDEKTTKPEKATHTRRATVVLNQAARAEIDHVADAFELPKKQVREAAGELASDAILRDLRSRLGAARLEAAKAELARLEGEMGVPQPDPAME